MNLDKYQSVCLCVYRCPTSTWKRPPSSPYSRRSWPSCQVKHTHIEMKRRPQLEGCKCNYGCVPSLMVHLLGGKDRRSGLILSIPLSSDQTSMEELSATLDYLLGIPRYQRTKTRTIPKTSHCFICLFMCSLMCHCIYFVTWLQFPYPVKFKQQRHSNF